MASHILDASRRSACGGYRKDNAIGILQNPFYNTAMSTHPIPAIPVDELKAQASEAVRKVSETINDQANILRDTATSARYNTQDFIENNPWQSVAIAAGIGFLVGVIVARR
jgi:DUF883 C-terminal glycine zipper region